MTNQSNKDPIKKSNELAQEITQANPFLKPVKKRNVWMGVAIFSMVLVVFLIGMMFYLIDAVNKIVGLPTNSLTQEFSTIEVEEINVRNLRSQLGFQPLDVLQPMITPYGEVKLVGFEMREGVPVPIACHPDLFLDEVLLSELGNFCDRDDVEQETWLVSFGWSLSPSGRFLAITGAAYPYDEGMYLNLFDLETGENRIFEDIDGRHFNWLNNDSERGDYAYQLVFHDEDEAFDLAINKMPLSINALGEIGYHESEIFDILAEDEPMRYYPDEIIDSGLPWMYGSFY